MQTANILQKSININNKLHNKSFHLGCGYTATKKTTTETSHKKVCQTQTSTCRDEILKNQPNKTGTTPQYFYTIPTSCAILPPVHNTKPSTFVLISPHQPQTNIVLHSIQLSHKITHPSQSITKLPLLTSQPPVYKTTHIYHAKQAQNLTT